MNDEIYKLKYNTFFLRILKSKFIKIYNFNEKNIKFSIGTSKKIIKKNYSKTPFKTIKFHTYINSLFYELEKNPKYKVIHNIIYTQKFKPENSFLYNSEIEISITKRTMFSLIQRILVNLKKLVRMYKLKKIKYYNTTNLLLEPFTINEKKFILYDYENYKKNLICYSFTCDELYKICEKNIITYDYDLFYDNVDLKNPYNNLSFTKSQLYNIFLFLHKNTDKQIPLFYYFYLCEFNKVTFLLKYDIIIKDYVINDYYKNLSYPDKFTIFLRIINYYYPIKLNISKLDNDVIYNFFKKKQTVVYDYLIYNYSFNDNLKEFHFNNIINKLKKTYDVNPMLGRIQLIFNHETNTREHIFNQGNNLY